MGSAQNQTNTDLLKALNLFRTQPQLAADSLLKPLIPLFNGDLFLRPNETPLKTKEGVKPLLELIELLENQLPTQALVFHSALEKSAKELAIFQEKTGYMGHSVVKGKRTHDRILSYNKEFNSTAECIAYGNYQNYDLVRVVISLLIDDNIMDRGHRDIMLSPNYQFMGAALKVHKRYGNVVVLNFAKN